MAMAATASARAAPPGAPARAATPSQKVTTRVVTYNIGAQDNRMFSGPAGAAFTAKLEEDLERISLVHWGLGCLGSVNGRVDGRVGVLGLHSPLSVGTSVRL